MIAGTEDLGKWLGCLVSCTKQIKRCLISISWSFRFFFHLSRITTCVLKILRDQESWPGIFFIVVTLIPLKKKYPLWHSEEHANCVGKCWSLCHYHSLWRLFINNRGWRRQCCWQWCSVAVFAVVAVAEVAGVAGRVGVAVRGSRRMVRTFFSVLQFFLGTLSFHHWWPPHLFPPLCHLSLALPICSPLCSQQ